MIKRFFDISAALLGIIFLFPIFFLIAVAIKIFMPGPIFFIQTRVGKDGHFFNLYKFRSMSIALNKEKGSFDIGDKSRVTPLGRLLRKTKMDELPQLFNVLRGQMSVVGPRPEVEKWTKVYAEKWKVVHLVRPGITDYASIHFRNEEEILAASKDPEFVYMHEILPNKLNLSIEYINTQSFWLDLKIIFATIKAIFIK
jgi:lipopolysaccharide/colanic/teichoic acid biosynthesis glycosyltransferase